MARKGEAVWRRVRAWDTSSNAPATGDAANLTLKIAKDNGAPAAVAGSISEDGYGYYRVQISATENDCWSAQLAGESSTANVIVLGREWDNYEFSAGAVLESVLEDHDEAGSLAEALLTMLHDIIGPARTTETDGGATRKIYDDALDGTVRETITISQAGDVTEKTSS